MEEEITSGSDNIVTEFNTYEDFLDSQISSLDLYYLEVSKSLLKLAPNSTLARKLFEQPHILQKMFVIVLLMCVKLQISTSVLRLDTLKRLLQEHHSTW